LQSNCRALISKETSTGPSSETLIL
jgi:hypothetical protein